MASRRADASSGLRQALTEGVPLRRKPRARVEPSLGGSPKLSCELTTLLAVHETHALNRQWWGELRPFFFVERFAFAGPSAASKHLQRLPKLGWPVYFDAHFWNAFPIGATGGADYWLAQSESPDGIHSAVYLYDHETGSLTREAPSIESLVRRQRKLGAANAKALRAPLLDARVLYRRSYWLTTVLRGEDPDDLAAELGKHAPPFAAFASEREQLAEWPHLALYWLFAHMVLENRKAFQEAFANTATSKNTFVASARALCQKLFSDETAGVGAFTARRRAYLRTTLADLRPLRVFEPHRRATLERGGARDPDSDELAIALGALSALARGDAGLGPAAELLTRFARTGGSPGRLKWPSDWRVRLADPRLETVLLILFRRGQQSERNDRRRAEWSVVPLAKIGGPRVFESFLEAVAQPGRSHPSLAVALATSRDPRATAFFARMLRWLSSPGAPMADLGHLRLYIGACVVRYVALDDPESLEQTLATVLAGKGFHSTLKYGVADIAVERDTRSLASALVVALEPWFDEKPHYSCQDPLFHLGSALAALAPELASKHFTPVWEKFLGYGPWREARSNPKLVAIGSAILVPLLGSTAKETYLPIARTLASWLDDIPFGSPNVAEEWVRAALHLLRGFRLNGDGFGRDLAKRFANFDDRSSDHVEAVRKEAARILVPR